MGCWGVRAGTGLGLAMVPMIPVLMEGAWQMLLAEAGWDCKFHTGTLGLEVLLQGSSAASLLLS